MKFVFNVKHPPTQISFIKILVKHKSKQQNVLTSCDKLCTMINAENIKI